MATIDNTDAGFSITPYQVAYRAAVRSIIDTTLGNGYLANLDHWVTRDQVYPLVAVSDDVVIGFGVAEVASVNFVQPIVENLDHEQSQNLFQAARNNSLGVVQTVVVSPDHQRSGIGSRLVSELETKLWIAGSEWILTPTWESPEGIDIETLLLRAGYSELVKISAYWQAECDSGQFVCPSRTTSCQCNAVFYGKVTSS